MRATNSRLLRCIIMVGVTFAGVGCSHDTARVALEARPPSAAEPYALAIRAQLSGPQDGVRYRWYSVSGECDPQESDSPETVFTFAEGSTRDRVTVEIWRGAEQIARSELDVALGAQQARAAAPELSIALTDTPRYEPHGGPDTRGEIAGNVTGELTSSHKVIIYARADVWYVQPHPGAFHDIRTDGSWSSWTHTGSSYAVLVVKQPYNMRSRLDVLPQVGGQVLARSIVEGVRR